MYVTVYVHLYVCTLATVPYICMYVHLCLMYTYVMFVYIWKKEEREQTHNISYFNFSQIQNLYKKLFLFFQI